MRGEKNSFCSHDKVAFLDKIEIQPSGMYLNHCSALVPILIAGDIFPLADIPTGASSINIYFFVCRHSSGALQLALGSITIVSAFSTE